jgi:hypothetical protein
MSDQIKPDELVIDDANYLEHCSENDNEHTFGLVPRDYDRHPVGSVAGVEPFNIPLIPRNEWSSRIRDMVQSKSLLSDIVEIGDNGRDIDSLDQNGQGYCWAYSPAAAITACRARDGQPYVRLSAHAVACKIKGFRDEGGWNPLAVEYAIKHGYPSVEAWPEKSMSRSNDRPETWANAANYKIVDGWMDLQPPVYDRNLTLDQLFTCLLLRIPCPTDHNWWGHSICTLDPVEIDSSLPLNDANRWGTRIWNSWRHSWGTRGKGILRGRKCIPDGATACKGVLQSN